MENGIFLLLGTNLGDRLENIRKAVTEIASDVGNVIKQSSIYQTAPWGQPNQPDFYNVVIEIETEYTATELLERLLKIETSLGRTRKERWGARTIDIDILFYNNEVIDSENLSVPHPAIASRRFTLVPLAEIAAELVHPVSKKTITELLSECPDDLPVTLVNL